MAGCTVPVPYRQLRRYTRLPGHIEVVSMPRGERYRVGQLMNVVSNS